jgi:hypothetical protein
MLGKSLKEIVVWLWWKSFSRIAHLFKSVYHSSYYGIIILFLGKCEDCTTNELIKHFTHPSILNKSQRLWVFVFIDHADTNDEFDQAVRNISQSTFFLHNIWTTFHLPTNHPDQPKISWNNPTLTDLLAIFPRISPLLTVKNSNFCARFPYNGKNVCKLFWIKMWP